MYITMFEKVCLILIVVNQLRLKCKDALCLFSVSFQTLHLQSQYGKARQSALMAV